MKITGTAPDMVTLQLEIADIVDIHACLNYLAETFEEQDAVLLGLPGAKGEVRINQLAEAVRGLLEQLQPQQQMPTV